MKCLLRSPGQIIICLLHSTLDFLMFGHSTIRRLLFMNLLRTKILILCVTETWQKPNDYFYLNQTVPSEYEYISKLILVRGVALQLFIMTDIKSVRFCYQSHQLLKFWLCNLKV